MTYVTHDQIEAITLADKIVVMHGGYIQQQGTSEVLFKHPKNKFVAGFLGSPPMNFLEADLPTEGDTLLPSETPSKLQSLHPRHRAWIKHAVTSS